MKKNYQQKVEQLRDEMNKAFTSLSCTSNQYGQPRPGFIRLDGMTGKSIVGSMSGYIVSRGEDGLYYFRLFTEIVDIREAASILDEAEIVVKANKAKAVPCNVFVKGDGWQKEIERCLNE